MTENISGANQAASKTDQSAEQFLEAIGLLNQQSNSLRSQVESFFRTMKAA